MATDNNIDLEQKVKSVIEQIRPYLQGDGGDIRYINITDDFVVNVVTLKNGVEETLKKAIPQIKSVEAINL